MRDPATFVDFRRKATLPAIPRQASWEQVDISLFHQSPQLTSSYNLSIREQPRERHSFCAPRKAYNRVVTMGNKPKALSVIGVALDLLQILFAMIVLVFVSWKLTGVEIEGLELKSSCLLNGSDAGFLSGSVFCIYAILVGVISLIANAIFGCLSKVTKCVTLNVCAASSFVSVIGDTALGVWWAVAFALFVRRGTAANDLGWPERGARDAVIASAFGGMIAFWADVVITIVGVIMS